MKICITSPCYYWEYAESRDYQCYITIEDDYDLEIISKIINEGDFIRIHGYVSLWMIVRNVNYIELPKKMIELTGKTYRSEEETVTIGSNIQIRINVQPDDHDRITKLNKMSQLTQKFEMYKKAISTEHIQNEGFRILQQYIDRQPYKVIYGNEVISSMKKQLVKVVFVSWNFIKIQEEQMIKILTHDSHKYNNTNIVVIWKGNEHYKELKNYGGIVGVLF